MSKKYTLKSANASTSINRAIVINFRNTNNIQDLGIHVTVCYLDNIPKNMYDNLNKTIRDEFNPSIQNSTWNLTFTNQWIKSWEVNLVNQRGVSIESYRKAIFEYVTENAQKYISKKRYPTGYPPLHTDVSNFIYTPATNKTFNKLNLYISQ